MSRLFSGSNDRVYCEDVVGFPNSDAHLITMACWIKLTDNVSSDMNVMGYSPTDDDSEGFNLILRSAPNRVGLLLRDSGGSSHATSTATLVVGNWYHACVVNAATNSRFAYTNGASKGSNTSTKTVNGAASIYFGTSGGNTRYLSNTYIAQPAVWDTALSENEILMLAKGLSPLKVKPTSLCFYAPYFGRDTSDIDIINGNILTILNSPESSTDEPPLLHLRKRNFSYKKTAAGESYTSSKFMLLGI